MSEEESALHSPEDELLIERFRAGDAEAFDRLMALHMDKIFGLAWSVLHNREEALDATQEVFIKLHSALPRFGDSHNLSAWLYRVCLNYCIDVKRKKQRVEFELTEEVWDRLQGPTEEEPAWFVQNRELEDTIREAIDQLPERQKMAFLLRHYQYLSLQEVAETMGCSVGAVKSHLSRATQHLRVMLASYVDVVVRKV